MKKIWKAVIAAVAFVGSAFAFAACAGGEHTEHGFTGAWVTTDPEYHWHICTADGCEETDEKVAHDWVADDSKTDVPATCIADGIHYLKCACGATKSRLITTRPDHSFTGAEWVTTDPDKHWHVCTTEGCNETDTPADHNWVDSEKPDKPATCIADGEHYLKCSGCGAEKIEPITTRPNHSYTGAEWVTTDPNYHWHVCTTDGCTEIDEKAAHSWEDGDVITQPDADNDGLIKVTCSVCHAESTKVIPATGHPKGTTLKYEEGGTTHWYGCTDHPDCGKKYDEAPHSFSTHVEAEDKPATCGEDGYTVWACECGAKERRTVDKTGEHDFEEQQYVSDGENGHYRECKVCHAHSATVAHSLVDGTTVTEPTFWAAGSKNVTCSDGCGYTGTATIERKDTASFVDDFSLDANPNGSWSYGKTVYNFANETFEFTEATGKNDGGDGWKIDGCCEIKKGFIDSGNWATVAFTFTEETAATVKFKFTGNNADDGNNTPNTFNCRIGVKNASGELYSTPAFIGGDGGLHVCSNLDKDGNGVGYNFNAGDTIYFMIEHVGGWASGNLELTITRNAQTNA